MNKTRVASWGPLLVFLVALGCGGDGDGDAGAEAGTDAGRDAGSVDYVPPDPVPVTTPAPPDVSGLPVTEDGDPILIDTGSAEISLDPGQRGPVSALAACMAVIEQCWREQGLSADNRVTVMDVCQRSAPTCTTDEPWNEEPCCPAVCWDRYEAARRAGQDPAEAEDDIYFGSDPCVSGVPPMEGGAP